MGVSEVNNKGVTWINIEKPSQKEISSLGERFHFHKLNLEDCLSKIQLTKIDKYEDYLFIILHFPIPSDNARGVTSSQVSIFLGKDYLVTIHEANLQPLVEIFENCRNDQVQREAIMAKSSSYILYRIIDALVDSLFPFLDKLMNKLETIEDEVFDERTGSACKLALIRREISVLRRIVAPHRRLVIDLANRVPPSASEDLPVYFDDIKDHIEKAWEMLESSNETINIFKDTDLTLNTQRTNTVLSILTILFTLTIPATVIGTFYGMNINLPGGIETGTWTSLGPYTTLVFILAISAIASASLSWYFHRLKWV